MRLRHAGRIAIQLEQLLEAARGEQGFGAFALAPQHGRQSGPATRQHLQRSAQSGRERQRGQLLRGALALHLGLHLVFGLTERAQPAALRQDLPQPPPQLLPVRRHALCELGRRQAFSGTERHAHLA